MSDKAWDERTAVVSHPAPDENRAARWAGWFMAITFLTSIPALLLYHSILHDHNFILGSDSEGKVQLGAFLEVLLIVANIGVAVVMFPILKREDERVALGYVASRIVEATMILIGVMALLAIITLRDASIGSDTGSVLIAGRTLVAVHDWSFLIGPGFIVGINDILLGYLMYKTALMPRKLALFGLIGGPLIFVGKTLVLFGAFDIYSSAAGLFAIPVFIFEASFAIYLIVQGFRPSRVLSGEPVAT